MAREDRVLSILEALGSITREFNVRGNYPFQRFVLGRPHIDILFLLSEKSPQTIKELSAGLNVTSGATTQFVDVLEARGLVERHDNPSDKRSRLVGLTSASRRELREFQAEYIRTIGSVFDALDSGELHELEKLLAKLRKK